jgi:hypothetical protein
MAQETFITVVTDAFGMRESSTDILAGQQQASTAANGVIDSVNNLLSGLESEGSSALSSATSAISALSSFSPTAINETIEYPEFTAATVTEASSGSIAGVTASLNAGVSLSFNPAAFTPQSAPIQSTTKPALSKLTAPKAPSALNTAGVPTEPPVANLSIPQAPGAITLADLNLPTLTAPGLKDFKLPSFTAPELPTFTPPASGGLPEVPGVVVTTNLRTYTPTFVVNETPTLLVDGGTLVGSKLVDREVRQAVEVFSSRGMEVSDALRTAQTLYAGERGALMNAAELRKFNIDEVLRNAEVAKALLTLLVQLDAMTFEASMAYARGRFEVETLKADAQIQLANALASLYNARVAEFKTEVEFYQSEMSSQIVGLEKWKAEVQAEIAKTKANAQIGRVYASQIEAVTAQAAVYEAQVQALFANVENYKARMQAVEVEADVAKTAVMTYAGKVDAYVASLTGIKAQYEVYEAGLKGTMAMNEAETTKIQLSMSDIQAVGASYANSIAKIELDTEQLKAAAMQKSAQAEAISLTNIIEGLKAQIEGDKQRLDVAKISMAALKAGSKNEAIVDNAQAAARYYGQVSDSIYRSHEQIMRAVMTSTQASAMAMEAAGKTAASLAQGAYSAMHVSASIQGGGRISGTEERQDRIMASYSDMLNSRESVEKILSA